jgi:hypothetical protein
LAGQLGAADMPIGCALSFLACNTHEQPIFFLPVVRAYRSITHHERVGLT